GPAVGPERVIGVQGDGDEVDPGAEADGGDALITDGAPAEGGAGVAPRSGRGRSGRSRQSRRMSFKDSWPVVDGRPDRLALRGCGRTERGRALHWETGGVPVCR